MKKNPVGGAGRYPQPREQKSAEAGQPVTQSPEQRPRWERGPQAWEDIYSAEMKPRRQSEARARGGAAPLGGRSAQQAAREASALGSSAGRGGKRSSGAAVQSVGAASLAAAEGGRRLKRGKKAKRAKRKKTWLDYLLNVLIVVLLLVGLYYLLRPYYVRWQRGRVADELRQSLNDGSLKKIPYDPNAYLLQNPEYDVYDVLGDGSLIQEGDGLSAAEVTPGLSYLTPLGTLQIPKMELNTPIIAEMDYGAMFYGASHWEETPLPGLPGNSVMLLHRTRYADYDFYDVDKLKEKDIIGVIREGKQYSFEIVKIQSILPDVLITTLKNSFNDGGAYVTLVTCDPPNVSTHRLLVTAKLVSTRDVKK